MARKAKAANAATAKKPSTKRGARKKKGGPDPVDIHVGGRVRLRRMMLGMSQEAVGKALDLTFQQVQKYERGANRIGAGRLMQLSELLGVPVQYFYDGYKDGSGAPGFAESDAGDPFEDLLRSPEGVQLCRHFSEIKDAKVRKKVLELVRSISETEAERDKVS
jgi:transcriptional regulator with XRE-family HTH domain